MAAATRKAPDGRQARWARHNRERRQVIIDAAIEVIGTSARGDEVHVQQIADQAGLSRTVVYRHFGDRADLDRAVQADIVDLIRGELIPALSLEGTPVEIIRRIIAAYVGFAVEHPGLHRFVERPLPQEESAGSALDAAVSQIATQIEQLITLAVDTLDVELEEAATQALDPLVFGLVGAAFNAVRRWLGRPVVEPEQEVFVDLLTEATWLQIAGMARVRGLDLDPDVPLEQLLASTPADDGPDDADG